MASQAQAKGLAFTVDAVPAEVPDVLEGDATRLRQILMNLLGNAMKFTEHGGVTLGLARVEGAPDPLRLRFTVRDTGVGMSPEVIGRLFQPFMQADASTTRRYGGTGLGLSIVRQLSEHLGGQVSVASQPGVGSTFHIELPFAVSTAQPFEASGVSDRRSFSVIVADDDAACREHLSTMARGFGWQVEEVDDGEALVDRVLQRVAERRPVDCLLVDWQMPRLDGLQALRRLSEALGPQSVPGTIVVTAHGLEEVMRSPFAGLPDSLLVKPVDSSKLFYEVNAAVIKHGGQPQLVLDVSRLAQPQVRWLDGMRVLLVDDSEINLEVAQEILRSEGAIVSTCQSGQEALDWLHTPGQSADVVLMDVQMPVMDGNTAVRRLREDVRFAHLPVIALTAGALLSERERSYEAGMDDYLTKPFEPEQMVRVVRRHVERARGAPWHVGARGAEAAGAIPDWPEVAGIDTQAVRARLNGDVALFLRSLDHLMAEFGDLQGPSIVPADEAGRQALLARLHKLVGNTGLVGATAVQRHSQAAERCLREHDDAGLRNALGDLAMALHALALAIEPWQARSIAV
jgi:CheY-like chemotaxis protein